jgi:Ca2+-binding EF-hand superfamily protein
LELNMAKRKLVLVLGALVVLGGAAAIAAVGQRDGRMGHRGGMHDMGDADGMGWGGGRGQREGRGGGSMRGDRDDMMGGRGPSRRGVTADDLDARMREQFARIDKNSDGVIDAAEVEAAMAAQAQGRGSGRIREWMGRRTGSGDAAPAIRRTRQEYLDRVKRDFARMDLDGDGRITEADLPPVMRGRDVLKGNPAGTGGGRGAAGGMMGGGMGLGALIAADANKDGIITLDEVLAAAGKRFDLMDRNKDGALDATDRDAMNKEMTDYRVQRFLHGHAAKDGKVTREQFFATAKERFADHDRNGDGRFDRQDTGPGRGMGPGMGRGPVREGGPLPQGAPAPK